jgi:hypothetical protein
MSPEADLGSIFRFEPGLLRIKRCLRKYSAQEWGQRDSKNLHSQRGFCFPQPDGMRYSRRPQGKMDNIIEARELQIERKHFYVELRENDRGRFLRITEEAHGRRNSIIVPSTGVDDFTATIAEVLTNGETAPA